MTEEFKKTVKGNRTVYTLESASGGGTSAGSVASVSKALGGVQRRPKDSIFAQEEKQSSQESPKPRNFVAKNSKMAMSGAGQHRDKKRDQKQGVEKHKKPFYENDEEHPFAAFARERGLKVTSNQGIGLSKKPEPAPGGYLKPGDVERLPELEARLSDLRAKYQRLGGMNWQYADREQNLTPDERKARSMGEEISRLIGVINYIKRHAGITDTNTDKTDEDWGKGGYDTYMGGNHGRGVTETSQGSLGFTLERYKMTKNIKIHEDPYITELSTMLAEKLSPNDPVDVWVQDFLQADPNKYHQFKNKTPEKKAKMAAAASYSSKNPSKKVKEYEDDEDDYDSDENDYEPPHGIVNDPDKALEYAEEELDGRFFDGEKAIASKGYTAYYYAQNIIKGPWPPGEMTIAQDADLSYYYAENIIKGRWKPGEKAIAKDPYYSLLYAQNVINGRWKPGEAAIVKNLKYAKQYAQTYLKGPEQTMWLLKYSE